MPLIRLDRSQQWKLIEKTRKKLVARSFGIFGSYMRVHEEHIPTTHRWKRLPKISLDQQMSID